MNFESVGRSSRAELLDNGKEHALHNCYSAFCTVDKLDSVFRAITMLCLTAWQRDTASVDARMYHIQFSELRLVLSS